MKNPKNFDEIYSKYVDKIYRFVFLKVNSQAIAQDLTSDTFMRTLEYLRANQDQEIANMQAFLYKTARNAVFDYYRQKSRQDVSLEYETAGFVGGVVSGRDMPDFAAEQNEEIAVIRKALGKMDSAYGDILTLHYVEDMSIKEIADMVEKPQGTVRVMLHRGLKELRGLLE